MKIFINEDAEELYYKIIELNKSIISDLRQEARRDFGLINESSLINYCNSIFSTKPFSDELICETFEEGIAYTIFHLNKGHCFLDGNKRTTLATVMYFIEEFEMDNFNNMFFSGIIAGFLVDMLTEKMTEEDVLKWVEKQFKSKI